MATLPPHQGVRGQGGDKLLLLVPLSDRHLSRRAEFANDPELRTLLRIPADAPRETPDSEKLWVADRLAAGDVLLAIEVGGEYVGDIGVFFIPKRGSAEFTLVLGNARFRGQGVGTEVVRRVLRWLFADVLPPWPSSEATALDRPQFTMAYVEVDTNPGRNPMAHRFWLRQGFRLHRFEEELHWLRLTREEWLASTTDPCPTDPTSAG